MTNKAGVQVTIETTSGKRGGNANMFTWQWGKVFAQGPGDTAGFIRIHFNTRETLLTSNACARITLQTLTKQHRSHKAMLVNPQNNTLRDNICRSYICVVILVLEKVSVFLKKTC